MKKNFIIILVNLVFVVFLYVVLEVLIPAHPSNRHFELEVPKGTTFRQAVEILSRENLIRDKNIFIILGRITDIDRKIKSGYYSIWGSMNPLDIFRLLRNGQIIEHTLRIVEGDSLFKLAKEFSEIGILSEEDFLNLARDPELLSLYKINAESIEGYIFPDTYKIPKGIQPEEAIGLMINRMREKYSGELLDRTAEIGMTEHEVLTLASIIEKEAVINKERALISAVYHNRLKKNMRLQADPTAIYGVKSSNRRITRADLRRKTPYNTYAFEGLPPGPIASPGLNSIKAALYPSDVPYLYFVSKDDLSHHFSKTAQEHLNAVKRYREWKKDSRENRKASAKADETS
jgi:UPF0755 protein